MADYVKTTHVDHTTNENATVLNHVETQYDSAKTEYQAGNWGAPPSVPAANITGDIALSQMTVGTNGYFLKGQGAGDPVYAAIGSADVPDLDMAKITTGTLPVTQGGTGLAAVAQGGILYASGADTISRIAPTGANQVVRSTGANALQIAALDPADIPDLAATILTSGTLDPARLPAMSQASKGAVPATGVPSGLYLKDDGTFDTPAGTGTGDVSSIDAVAVDNQIVRENLTSGKSIQKVASDDR